MKCMIKIKIEMENKIIVKNTQYKTRIFISKYHINWIIIKYPFILYSYLYTYLKALMV